VHRQDNYVNAITTNFLLSYFSQYQHSFNGWWNYYYRFS